MSVVVAAVVVIVAVVSVLVWFDRPVPSCPCWVCQNEYCTPHRALFSRAHDAYGHLAKEVAFVLFLSFVVFTRCVVFMMCWFHLLFSLFICCFHVVFSCAVVESFKDWGRVGDVTNLSPIVGNTLCLCEAEVGGRGG